MESAKQRSSAFSNICSTVSHKFEAALDRHAERVFELIRSNRCSNLKHVFDQQAVRFQTAELSVLANRQSTDHSAGVAVMVDQSTGPKGPGLPQEK